MFRFKLNTLTTHVAGWLLFLLFPLLFLNSGDKSGQAWLLLTSSFYWLFCVTYLILFYFNVWYLIPQFFLKGRQILYIGCVLILLCGVYFLQPFNKLIVNNPRFQAQLIAEARKDSVSQLYKTRSAIKDGNALSLPFGPLPHQDLRMQEPVVKPSRMNPLWKHSSETDTVSLVLFFIITALALSVKTMEQWNSTKQAVIKAESEKVSAELSFLKAQINPHFLFNTLNNIYTLSVMNHPNTSDSIMKLSNIMRYVTDDVMQDFVPLENELKCVENYVDLQKLRLGKNTNVNFTIKGVVRNQLIAPLIMMTFIENAFKYGISKKVKSDISILIAIEPNLISFCSENTIFESQITERSGIGIANTKQRLELLYPKTHHLQIENKNGLFKVELYLTS